MVVACFVVALGAVAPDASSGILSKLLREAGEAGGKAAKHGAGSLDNAASALKKLPDGEGSTALGVHATPEGHWVLVNKKGDQFTAGTPDELMRAPKTLLGNSAAGKPLSLYLTEDTVFAEAARIKDLPSTAKLHMVSNKRTYPLVRAAEQSSGFVVRVRPSLNVALNNKALVQEVFYRMARPLNRANIRVLALEPGGPKRLSSVPGYDPKTKQRLTERVDPADLGRALTKLKGQTVVVTGEVKGNALHFQPASGASGKIPLSELSNSAASADVNLIVLRSTSPTQPGTRNWLWQKVEIDGLETALNRSTYADFLESVSANSGDLLIKAEKGTQGRIVITANPTGGSSGVTGQIGGWIDTISEQVTGSIATNGILTYARNKDQEREYAWRLLPGVPSGLQITYVLGLIAGLMGFGVARGWWRKLWPQEVRAEYASNFGYQAARCARGLAFILLFLPLFGVPAVIWSFLRPLLIIVAAPFRFIGGLLRRQRS